MKKDRLSIMYREKYNKGCEINKNEIHRLISENIHKIKVELRERTKYSDNTEEIVVSIRL